MKQKTRPYITVEPPVEYPPYYIVVEYGGDVVVAPQGPGKYEDSSCAGAPHPPVVFSSYAHAKKVAEALCVDSVGFCSFWEVRQLPDGCTATGLDILLLPEFAAEAARMREVYGENAFEGTAA